jgi:hypothetical protein
MMGTLHGVSARVLGASVSVLRMGGGNRPAQCGSRHAGMADPAKAARLSVPATRAAGTQAQTALIDGRAAEVDGNVDEALGKYETTANAQDAELVKAALEHIRRVVPKRHSGWSLVYRAHGAESGGRGATSCAFGVGPSAMGAFILAAGTGIAIGEFTNRAPRRRTTRARWATASPTRSARAENRMPGAPQRTGVPGRTAAGAPIVFDVYE